MAILDPTASAMGLGVPPQEAQMLAGLLGSLMPLLQRAQEGGFSLGRTANQPWLAPTDPRIDHQAAVAFAQDLTADCLRRLSAYCEEQAGRHPGVESCIGLVTQAARSFAAADYNGAMGLAWQAYRVIAALRAVNPDLPLPGGQATSPTEPRTEH